MAWERTMAELALQLGDLQGAICHALQAIAMRTRYQSVSKYHTWEKM